MSKTKIIALAIAAVVIISAAVAAVPIVRHFTVVEESTTVPTTQPEYEYPTYVPVNNDPVEPSSEDLSVSETIKQIADITKATAKKTPTTKKNTNNNKVTTTKKNTPVTTTKKSGSMNTIVDDAIGGPYQLLGYRKDIEKDYYYCDDKDCWQKNAGYNEIYDNLATGAAMLIDQIRIRFTYEHKDWMIQFWKGQYGWLLVGAEIGVYTAPEGTYKNENGSVNHYNCADQSDWLKMQLDCYFSNTKDNPGKYVKVFTRPYDSYWWATGFVKGQLTKYNIPRTEIKVKGRITLKTQEMADIFVEGLKACGFARATSATQLPDDTYYQNGKDVYVLWSTIYHDCFVGYEG